MTHREATGVDQPDLLGQRGYQQGTGGVTSTHDAAPLSFAQERLWFLDQYLAGSPIYHIPVPLRLRGPLQPHLLERALTEITARHEVLRARFASTEGGLRQVPGPVEPIALAVRDADRAAGTDPDAAIADAINRELEQPLDLATAPPFHAALIRIGPDDHLLVCRIHHIAFDGWSLNVLLDELAALYAAYAAGEPSPLPPLQVSYGAYAAGQRDLVHGKRLDDQLAYWQEALGDGVPLLELAADRPLPRVPTYRGGQLGATLAAPLADGLRRLADQENTTGYTVIVAAFKILLARHAGVEDVVVGVPVANRDQPELDRLIGLFLNMVVSRSDLSGRPTFRDVIRRVWDGLLDAYANHELPFEILVEKLQPDRSATRTPFVDVVVNLLPTASQVRFGGITCTPVEVADRYSGYAMTLYVREDGSGLELVYQREKFDRERMRDFLDQLVLLIEQATADPDRDMYSYSLLTPAARRLLPDPAKRLELPEYEPVTATVERLAARLPARAAVRHGERVWSYAELTRSVRSVAAALATAGHRPGDVVAIFGQPSFGYVASFLGVMAARCVALPLDDSVPPQRQLVMLEAANASRLLLVGDADAADRPCPVLRVGADGSTPAGPDGTEPGRAAGPVRPGDAAYIYFTSGTSGNPKGILGENNTLAHLITWERETFCTGPADRCGLTTRLSFDMVLRDIFLPLTSGGTLCIPPDETLILDASAALRWLEEERITLLHIVPTLASRWLEHAPACVRLPDMRWVYFAGEPLAEGLVRRWRTAFKPGGTAVNYYGTTETMVRTYHVVPPEPHPGVQSVGAALPHCQTIIANHAGVQCGIGELGEVLLRSRICTKGYINAPREQLDRFVPNHFLAGDPQDICYRTGDVGRYRPDGTADVLGRHDDQLKIHGVRVEPAEVQAAVSTHPTVAAAVVVPAGDELVGYVVPRNGACADAAELRRHLRQRLPETMIPASFVTLAAVPTLSNGKVDKKALPPPGKEQAGPAGAATGTETELVLARIWREVLGVAEVRPTDNFFDLGGHSLKAVDAVARIRAELGVDLPLRVLFEEPTLASVAAEVERHATDQGPALGGLLDDADMDAIIAALEALEEEES